MTRGMLIGMGVAVVAALLPATAGAEIVYTHGTTAPPTSGTWTAATLWSMNDNGSSPEQLVSAAQAGSNQQAVADPSLSANSAAAVFEGFDYQFANAGSYGEYYEGMYVLSGGTISRLSPAPQAASGESSYDAPAVLTANGQVIYQFQGAEGNPPGSAGANWSMDEMPDTGGTATPWQWVGDNGNNTSTESNASYPPATFASDPNNPALAAYAINNTLYIDNQTNSSPETVATQTSAWDDGGIGWSPDGTSIVDVDNGSGSSQGLWTFAAGANSTGHQVLVSNASSGDFENPVYVGQNEIAFQAENNIWEVPASCNACAFPSGATQLTTDGTTAAPDSNPSWTSQTVAAPGSGTSTTPTGTTTTPTPTSTTGTTTTTTPTVTRFATKLSVTGRQNVVRQKSVRAVYTCTATCSAALSARITISGSRKVYTFTGTVKKLIGGRSYTLTLSVSRTALAAFKAALARHRAVAGTLVITATDSSTHQKVRTSKTFRIVS